MKKIILISLFGLTLSGSKIIWATQGDSDHDPIICYYLDDENQCDRFSASVNYKVSKIDILGYELGLKKNFYVCSISGLNGISSVEHDILKIGYSK